MSCSFQFQKGVFSMFDLRLWMRINAVQKSNEYFVNVYNFSNENL